MADHAGFIALTGGSSTPSIADPAASLWGNHDPADAVWEQVRFCSLL
jgi:hypothetical protein